MHGSSTSCIISFQSVMPALKEELEWQRKVILLVVEETSDGEQWLPWSAQCPARCYATTRNHCTAAISHGQCSLMMTHSIDITRSFTPDLTADQQLYALAKEIQWSWPMTHGNDTLVVMFGGPHIEFAVLKVMETCSCTYLSTK